MVALDAVAALLAVVGAEVFYDKVVARAAVEGAEVVRDGPRFLRLSQPGLHTTVGGTHMCPHPRRASAAVLAHVITELIQRSGVRAVARRARGKCANLTLASHGVSTSTRAAGAVAATALSAAGAEAGASRIADAIR